MQSQLIPIGFDGQIRRVGPGSNLQIDHCHPELEFNLVLRGQGAYVLSGQRFELQPGVLVWLQPGQQHRLLRSSSLEMWVMVVHPDLVDEAFRRDVAAHPSRLLSGDDAVELDRLLTQVSQDADEPGLFNAGLGYALRRARRATRDSAGQEREVLHPAVLKALLLLRRHVEAPSLDDLASASGVTRSYLSRLLVQQTGRGFTEWRNRARLERFHVAYAKSPNLMTAALDAGFGSYVQFHRVCRELMGCTPREWVRDWAQANAATGGPERPSIVAFPGDVPEPLPGSEGRKGNASAPSRPALPSAHGILPALDGSRRMTWYPLAGLILPGILRWWNDRLIKVLLGYDARARPESTTLPDGTFFVPTSQHSSKVLNRLVQELRATDERIAARLASAFELHDLRSLYVNVVTAYGLDPNNVTDALTAYLAVAWVTANGAADPSFTQVEALRSQCRDALAKTTTLAGATDMERQDAYETFVHQFAITYSALMAARASGNPATMRTVSDAVASAVQEKLGCDLRSFRFDESGFRMDLS